MDALEAVTAGALGLFVWVSGVWFGCLTTRLRLGRQVRRLRSQMQTVGAVCAGPIEESMDRLLALMDRDVTELPG